MVYSTLVKPTHIHWLAFLTSEFHNEILTYAVNNWNQFHEAVTVDKNKEWRQARVLFESPLFNRFQLELINILPQVFNQVDVNQFLPSLIEIQLTAHGHNNFYRRHNDNGTDGTSKRKLSFVYYFNAKPKNFYGGQLKIHDTNTIIEPIDNSIVFFDSSLMHEVLPIVSPSMEWRNSRFTINGWLSE